MAAAGPVLFKALTAASAVSSARNARDARKDQKDQFAATEQRIAANKPQEARAPSSILKRRRRAGGFSDDVGAASASLLPGENTSLGK